MRSADLTARQDQRRPSVRRGFGVGLRAIAERRGDAALVIHHFGSKEPQGLRRLRRRDHWRQGCGACATRPPGSTDGRDRILRTADGIPGCTACNPAAAKMLWQKVDNAEGTWTRRITLGTVKPTAPVLGFWRPRLPAFVNARNPADLRAALRLHFYVLPTLEVCRRPAGRPRRYCRAFTAETQRRRSTCRLTKPPGAIEIRGLTKHWSVRRSY